MEKIEGLDEALKQYEEPRFYEKFSQRHMSDLIYQAAKAYQQLTERNRDE